MNISPISLMNFSTTGITKNNAKPASNMISSKNLAPLAKDTVSFSATPETNIKLKAAIHREDYEEVLKEAQQLGYAEFNPTSDVEGFDVAYKLSILASLAFHTCVPYQMIHREGITKISKADIKAGLELGQNIEIVTYSTPDFSNDLTPEYLLSLQVKKNATSEFIQECLMQTVTDWEG